MPKDYYQILNVSKTATQDEIKKAFRKLAHEHHPDKKTGNEAKFKELNEAYQILSNQEKRQKYDQFGSAAFEGQGFAGTGMNWEDIMRQAGFGGRSAQGGWGGGDVNIDFGDLGDILGGMFGFSTGRGRGPRRGHPTRGEDMEIEISLDFMEAVFGVEKTIRLEREIKCQHCRGNGAAPGTPIKICTRCGGAGEVIHTRTTILGNMQSRAVCPECQGEGKSAETRCPQCGGRGRKPSREDVKIKIPAGIDGGQTVKMSGLGSAGLKGGASGDLYIHIRVRAHKKFKRDSETIHTLEPISISQAVLGDDITVETVQGAVKLKIPSGTPAGKVFKLAGKGVPRIHGSTSGDHLVTVDIIVPAKLSRKEKEIFEQLRKIEKGDKGWF